MRIHFLIGGTGNQFFQLSCCQKDTIFSKLFLSRSASRLFGLQRHEVILELRRNYFWEAVGLMVLGFDILLYKFIKISLFSEVDLNSIKFKPTIRRIASIGYFQYNLEHIDIERILGFFRCDRRDNLAIHIRGGDFLASENSKVFGKLTNAYYNFAVSAALALLDGEEDRYTVYTDDIDRAGAVIEKLSLQNANIESAGLRCMIENCVGSDLFIASNSTLSYWIIVFRNHLQKKSFAPYPFQKNQQICLPVSNCIENVENPFE